jgi:hypothetical protein
VADRNREYRTGEDVADAGAYTCEAGHDRDFKQGEEFAACPVSGGETTWRPKENR